MNLIKMFCVRGKVVLTALTSFKVAELKLNTPTLKTN